MAARMMLFAGIIVVAFLAQHLGVEAKASSRILVLLDNMSVKETHSTYFRSLKGMGQFSLFSNRCT